VPKRLWPWLVTHDSLTAKLQSLGTLTFQVIERTLGGAPTAREPKMSQVTQGRRLELHRYLLKVDGKGRHIRSARLSQPNPYEFIGGQVKHLKDRPLGGYCSTSWHDSKRHWNNAIAKKYVPITKCLNGQDALISSVCGRHISERKHSSMILTPKTAVWIFMSKLKDYAGINEINRPMVIFINVADVVGIMACRQRSAWLASSHHFCIGRVLPCVAGCVINGLRR